MSQLPSANPPASLGPGPLPLNEGQHRRMGTILFGALATLDRVLALARQEHDPTGRWTGTLSPGERERLVAAMQRLHEEILAVIAALGLTPAVRDINHAIHGLAGLLRADLAELTPERISGYGRLDARIGAYLEEQIASLTTAALHLTDGLENHHV
jgi:hypothetical protein